MREYADDSLDQVTGEFSLGLLFLPYQIGKLLLDSGDLLKDGVAVRSIHGQASDIEGLVQARSHSHRLGKLSCSDNVGTTDRARGEQVFLVSRYQKLRLTRFRHRQHRIIVWVG